MLRQVNQPDSVGFCRWALLSPFAVPQKQTGLGSLRLGLEEESSSHPNGASLDVTLQGTMGNVC